jgi:uncharacterized protein (DUF1786 family)
MDIGSGTKDILLYDDRKKLENCTKMILPSPTTVYAAKVNETTKAGINLLITGDTIGGGKMTSAISNHLKNGLEIYMYKKAAYSIRNNIDEVKSYGIKIIDNGLPKNFDGKILEINEVNINDLHEFLLNFNEDLSDVDVVAIAVQDHGVPPKGISNRKFRIDFIRKRIFKNPNLESLAFIEDDIPNNFLRMKSAIQASKRELPKSKVLVMDTSLVALKGCSFDPMVVKDNAILAVNFGNEHTLAAILIGNVVIGMMEHHTELLSTKKIASFLNKFMVGELTNKEMYDNGGHGAFYTSSNKEMYDNGGHGAFYTSRFHKTKIDSIIVTGPNRNLIKKTGLDYIFAMPAGDMMMTGPIGLVEISKNLFSGDF